MATVLGILGFAALFVAFGIFRPGLQGGCGGNCGGACAADGSGCEAGHRSERAGSAGASGKER